MSMEAIKWARSQKCPNPTAKLILILLADYAGPVDTDEKISEEIGENHATFSGVRRLAEDAGLTVRAVQYQLAGLEEAGLIRRLIRYRPDGSQRTNYTVMILHPEGMQPTAPLGAEDPGPGVQLIAPLDTKGDTPLYTSNASRSPARTRARAHELPEDFELTEEMIEWARFHTPNCGREDHEEFMDYWLGRGGKHKDWVRTWHNWMRKANREKYRRPLPQFKTAHEKREEINARTSDLIDRAVALVESRGGSANNNAAVSAAMEELKRADRQGSMTGPYIDGVFTQMEITP